MDANNTLDAGVCRVDLRNGGAVVYGDEDFFKITGYSRGDISGGRLSLMTMLTDEYRSETMELLRKANREHKTYCLRQPIIRKDGSTIFVHCCGDFDEEGLARVILSKCSCQTRMEHAHNDLVRELSIQHIKLKMIADNTDDVYFDYTVENDTMMFTVDLTRYNIDIDNTLSGYMKDRAAEEFVHPDDRDKFFAEWEKALSHETKGSMEIRTKAYDDDYTWYNCSYISFADEYGNVTGVFGRLTNIQRMKVLATKVDSDSEYIQYLLTTDSLTGLLNQKGFNIHAEQVMKNRDPRATYGLVYSDINDFSYVNENFGYEAGNKMLKDFATCIIETSGNVVGCRIYSDFFIGIYKAASRDELIRGVEQRNRDFTTLQKKKYPASDIRISCGVYIIPHNETDINACIDNANLARRSFKHSSNILCGVYSQRMKMQKVYEQGICNELHSALETRRIEMFLQPKFHLETRTIIGAEALARWRNDDGTYKLPFEFIPVLEKVGYIDELDFFIYEEALRTLEKWKRDGKRLIPVSVNFSQHHITQASFVENIISTADKFDVSNSDIEIEITESSFSGDTQALFSVMEKLRAAGFKVSIDDFGVGYSTLSVLMNAPVDIVKIDKSFIDNIERSKVEREFVSNMCSLIETAHKDIIFEGVETDAQAVILCKSGYTKAQGWLFDKAIPVRDFEQKYMGYRY